MQIPDEHDLRAAPQRASLALLEAQLLVCEHAIKVAHDGFYGLPHHEPQKRVIARILVERFRELRCMLSAYETIVIKAPAKSSAKSCNSDDDDLPF